LHEEQLGDAGFTVRTYATALWHGLIDLSKMSELIVTLQVTGEVRSSDLLYGETASFRYAANCLRNESLMRFYDENAVRLLHIVYKEESALAFTKAKLRYELLTGKRFELDRIRSAMA
jgi:hypothetical protein